MQPASLAPQEQLALHRLLHTVPYTRTLFSLYPYAPGVYYYLCTYVEPNPRVTILSRRSCTYVGAISARAIRLLLFRADKVPNPKPMSATTTTLKITRHTPKALLLPTRQVQPQKVRPSWRWAHSPKTTSITSLACLPRLPSRPSYR